MAQPQTWVEALNISPKKLNEWSTLAPDGVPVLVYVLQEGHISAEDYLTWASEHYHLPVLREEYFQQAFEAETARNLQFGTGFECKPWLFPVEQWDGVLVVACHAPPEEPLGADIRHVLCDPRALQSAWSQMASSFTSTRFDDAPPEVPSTDVPTGLSSLETKPFKLSLDNLDESNLFRKDVFEDSATREHPDPVVRQESLATELPDKDSKVVSAPPIPEGSVVTSTVAGTATAPLLLDEDEVDGPPLHRTAEAMLKPAPPVTPGSKAPPPAPAAAAQPAIPMPSAKPKSKPSQPPRAKPKGPILTTEQQNEAIAMAFDHLKMIYKHVFIMRCSEGFAKLHKWDDSIHPTADQVQVDLAFPTFLRILHKTMLPYHGYLVDSPAHRELFGALQITELPGCVTAIPVKDGNTLLGVLVGVGDESLQRLDTLHKAEETAEKLVDALAPTWAKVA